jgi:prolyl-tRNA synthetase
MLQSKLFTKTSKEAPKDEPSLNAQLLEQGGFVQKVLAGVYSYLPLGNRVLRKIENIIREEMDEIGVEIFMPSLAPKENWEKTGRWNEVDVLFKLESQHGYEYALGPTHEEIVAPLAKKYISSYRDLPAAYYQIQSKFRDEARAKSGLMRGREFRMKDLYSFHTSQEDLDKYYGEAQKVYARVFERLGLKALLTEASGGSFSKFSHEYQVELPTGEDTIYICEKCGLAKNKEIFSGDNEECTNCGKTTWRETKASEVGNIFKLGTKFSEPFEVKYLDAEGKEQTPVMGCYGIGPSRVMGIIAELYNDDKGLQWPKNVAPFQIHVVPLASKDESMNKRVKEHAQKIHDQLTKAGMEVLLDDREETAGSKFADSDLIGIPYRVVISEKSLANDQVEIKDRISGEVEMLPVGNVTESLTERF